MLSLLLLMLQPLPPLLLMLHTNVAEDGAAVVQGYSCFCPSYNTITEATTDIIDLLEIASVNLKSKPKQPCSSRHTEAKK